MSNQPTVYVAQIDLKYEVIAVAADYAEAVELAANKAYAHLWAVDGLYPETDSPDKIIDYYGVRVTKITIGTAEYVGNE